MNTQPSEHSIKTLIKLAGELRPRLAKFEQSEKLTGMEHVPVEIRENLDAADRFRSAGETVNAERCLLIAILTFDAMEARSGTAKEFLAEAKRLLLSKPEA